MSSKCTILGLALLMAVTSIGRSQETSRTFSSAKGLPNDSDPSHFEFSVGGYHYKITAEGRGSVTKANGTRRFFNLRLTRGDRLNGSALYYADYDGDLLVLSDVGDIEAGHGFIARIDIKKLKLKWKNSIAGFNVGSGLIDEGYAYVTAMGFVGKINIESGLYAWKHRGLYGRKDGAFNSFGLPAVNGNTVVFKETPDSGRPKVAQIIVNRTTGKILKIDQ